MGLDLFDQVCFPMHTGSILKVGDIHEKVVLEQPESYVSL